MKRHWKQAAAFFLTAAITLGSSSFAVLAEETQTETKKAETVTIELLNGETESEMTELLTEEAESEATTEQGTDTTSEVFTEATTEQGTDTTPEVSTGDASEDEPATETTSTPETEPTSEEQKTVEQTGEEVLPKEDIPMQMEQNAMTADLTETGFEEKEIEQGAKKSDIIEIPMIAEWQGADEAAWSWVYVAQEQSFTLDGSFAEVFENHKIKWKWEPSENGTKAAVQLNPSADGYSCIAVGAAGHAGEKGKLIAEIFDEKGKRIGNAESGQIEVREPTYKYEGPETICMAGAWKGKRALRILCIPEDADHPYGTEEIPMEIVDIKVDYPNFFIVHGWDDEYVYLESDYIFRFATMTVTYKRMDNTLGTHSLKLESGVWEYWGGLMYQFGGFHPSASIVKPGETIEVVADIIHYIYSENSSDPIREDFTDFYVEWVILEGEDAVLIEEDKENKRLYLTAKEGTDGREVKIDTRITHLNKDGNVEELFIGSNSLFGTVQIDKDYERGSARELREGEDGKLYYYVDDEIDTEFEGIPDLDYTADKYYIKNGMVATDMNGPCRVEDVLDETEEGDSLYLFVNGKVDREYEGLVEFEGDRFYFGDGTIVTYLDGLLWVENALDETIAVDRFYYFTEGKVDTSFEGIAASLGDARNKFYVKDGTVATDMNGLHLIEDALDETTTGNVWYFFKEGQVDKWFEGVTEYNGGKFYIKDGTVATDVKGLRLVKDTQDETAGNQFYFFSQGQVQTQHTGLTQYDGAWFYVTKGVMDKSISGIVEYNGGKFIVAVGRICREVNGLWQDPKDRKWYFASNGQIQTQHTGVAAYDGALFYVINGELATDYEGTIKHNGVTYKVVNGQLYR